MTSPDVLIWYLCLRSPPDSEEELYARHREMRDALEKQRLELEDKKRRLESGRPLTPEKVSSVSCASRCLVLRSLDPCPLYDSALFSLSSRLQRRRASRSETKPAPCLEKLVRQSTNFASI